MCSYQGYRSPRFHHKADEPAPRSAIEIYQQALQRQKATECHDTITQEEWKTLKECEEDLTM
jgi:uncharacterized protein YjlB